jgi:hypothetical protein
VGSSHRFAQLEALVRRIAEDDGVWFARRDRVAGHVGPSLLGTPRHDRTAERIAFH